MNLETAAATRFSADYREARSRFCDAAETAGAALRSYRNPNTGPRGEALASDCAWLGPEDAEKVLVVMSGTHGVEGFCGSGVQLDWLAEGNAARLPPGHAALLIHAINPYGFAWIRRVTEENVDLNRNFVDFAAPLPTNPAYDALADALVPPALSGPEFDKADAVIAAFHAEHGEAAFHAARAAGQYAHPNGIFYGGTGPTWAWRTEEAIIADHRLAARRHVAMIDFHTGLGPFGYGELIVMPGLDSAHGRRLMGWYESVTQIGDPNSVASTRAGLGPQRWEELLGERGTIATLEYGTRSRWTMFSVLRADHWLHAYTNVDWDAAETRRIKAAIKDAYFPDSATWREMVLFRARQVLRQAGHGLAST
jgi:hypothetical protein